MYKKIKIIFKMPNTISDFISVCKKYGCGVNLFDDQLDKLDLSKMTLIDIFQIYQGKVMEGYLVSSSSDESVILSFINDMRKFEV